MDMWQEKRLLVLGMTYPSYSSKYTENVCTGAIEEDTGRLIRIHPVPLRYLDEDHSFKTFQWIRARVAPHPNDPRPESLRVDPQSIVLEQVLSSKEHALRRKLLEESPHLVHSVEELLERQQRDRVSLGIVKPKKISDLRIARRTAAERAEWLQKEAELLSQENLFGERMKRLDFPELKFLVGWECDDPRCSGHEMNLLEWGLHELARKYRHHPDREAKVLEAMQKRLDTRHRDVYLFLGNFRNRMYNFGLMGAWSAPAQVQHSLFD